MASMIRQYSDEYGSCPHSLDIVFEKMGHRYRRKTPYCDPYFNSNKTVKKYDGTGGWVFSEERRILGMNFRPYPFFTPKEIKILPNENAAKP